MTLKEAIEILQHTVGVQEQAKGPGYRRTDSSFYGASSDFHDALKLGIEALEFIKGLHDTGAMPSNALLPGETEE